VKITFSGFLLLLIKKLLTNRFRERHGKIFAYCAGYLSQHKGKLALYVFIGIVMSLLSFVSQSLMQAKHPFGNPISGKVGFNLCLSVYQTTSH